MTIEGLCKISKYSFDCSNLDLIISCLSEEIQSVGLMAKINKDGIRFADNFVTIKKIRQVGGSVFLKKFRFGFLEPFGCGLRGV